MTQSARDLENTFAHALTLLVRNPVILVPGIVVGALGAALELWFRALDESQTLLLLVIALLMLALAVAQMAYVTGMAAAAWRDERTHLRDGALALARRFVPAISAALLLVLLGFCAAVLAAATFGVTLIVYALLFIYTMSAVVIGERRPIAGLVESAGMSLRNFLPTLAVVALIVVIAVAAGWLGSLLAHLSDLAGWLLAGLLQQVIVAYASLVVVGEYLKLTAASTMS